MNLNYFGNRFKLYIIELGKSATSYPLIDTLYYGLITFGYIRQLFNIHARGKTLYLKFSMDNWNVKFATA